jgi:hypothetical protein
MNIHTNLLQLVSETAFLNFKINLNYLISIYIILPGGVYLTYDRNEYQKSS